MDYVVEVWFGVVRLEGLCEHLHCRVSLFSCGPLDRLDVDTDGDTDVANDKRTSQCIRRAASIMKSSPRPTLTLQFVIASHNIRTNKHIQPTQAIRIET